MGHIKRILAAIDGSEASLAGLTQAVVLAEDLEAEVVVLTVSTSGHFEVGSSTDEVDAERVKDDRARHEAIEDAQRVLGDRLIERTASGEAVRTILDVASNERCDLIVMGTHGRVGRLHALVGSVAEAVVRSAPCPVMTVRHGEGQDESFAERIHGRPSISKQPRPTH
jgi:nucleotide-binding universal stress UspA family protein